MSAGAWIFAVSLLLAWVKTAIHVSERGGMMYTDGPFRWIGSGGAGPIVLALAGTVVFLGAWSTFCFTEHVLAGGLVMLVWLGMFRQLEKLRWPDDTVVRLGKYAPTAAALLGYLAGRSLAPLVGSDPEHAGWNMAMGVLGATFSLAGAAKLQEAGSHWFRARGVQLLIYERALLARGPLRPLRFAIGSSWRACLALSAGALVLELAGVLFVVPALRWPMFGLTATLVTGFFLFFGYFELEWALALLAVTLMSQG